MTIATSPIIEMSSQRLEKDFVMVPGLRRSTDKTARDLSWLAPLAQASGTQFGR